GDSEFRALFALLPSAGNDSQPVPPFGSRPNNPYVRGRALLWRRAVTPGHILWLLPRLVVIVMVASEVDLGQKMVNQRTDGDRSDGSRYCCRPTFCLFWSQVGTSCLWPPRSVPISVLGVEGKSLFLNLHEAVTDLGIAALEAPPSFLQPQGQSLVLRFSLKGLPLVGRQHDPDPSLPTRHAVLVSGRDHRLDQPQVRDQPRPIGSGEPPVQGSRAEDAKTLAKRVIDRLPHAVVTQEVLEAVYPQDSAHPLRPDREGVPNILVERLPCRFPPLDHPPQLGGDSFLVRRQVLQPRVADRGDPIRHVADRVQVDRQAPVHQVFADTSVIGR